MLGMIKKYFCLIKLAKKMAHTIAIFRANLVITLGLEENANFLPKFGENSRKM
jgi:hypothetical protein